MSLHRVKARVFGEFLDETKAMAEECAEKTQSISEEEKKRVMRMCELKGMSDAEIEQALRDEIRRGFVYQRSRKIKKREELLAAKLAQLPANERQAFQVTIDVLQSVNGITQSAQQSMRECLSHLRHVKHKPELAPQTLEDSIQYLEAETLEVLITLVNKRLRALSVT